MNKKNLESLLVNALRSATRGLPHARAKVAAAKPVSSDELSTVSGGADRNEFRSDANSRLRGATGNANRRTDLFERFDFAEEGPGFVEFTVPDFLEASPPEFIEFTVPDFLEASPPEFIEFTVPDFLEATPPSGFGGGLR